MRLVMSSVKVACSGDSAFCKMSAPIATANGGSTRDHVSAVSGVPPSVNIRSSSTLVPTMNVTGSSPMTRLANTAKVARGQPATGSSRAMEIQLRNRSPA
jgi:hypothetical protein